MKKPFGGVDKDQIVNVLRRAGYLCLGRGQDEAELSFIRPFGRSGYPRFHLFVRFDQGKESIFDLHLDQRKGVYTGARAHGADYDGPLIEEEMERIATFL